MQEAATSVYTLLIYRKSASMLQHFLFLISFMLIRSDQNKFHFVSQFSIAVGTDLFIPVLDAGTHQASDNLSFSLHCLKSAMHMHTRKNPVTILVKQTWATDQLSTAATPHTSSQKKK